MISTINIDDIMLMSFWLPIPKPSQNGKGFRYDIWLWLLTPLLKMQKSENMALALDLASIVGDALTKF